MTEENSENVDTEAFIREWKSQKKEAPRVEFEIDPDWDRAKLIEIIQALHKANQFLLEKERQLHRVEATTKETLERLAFAKFIYGIGINYHEPAMLSWCGERLEDLWIGSVRVLADDVYFPDDVSRAPIRAWNPDWRQIVAHFVKYECYTKNPEEHTKTLLSRWFGITDED